MTDVAPGPISVLLYDGECGLCARSVLFVLQREPSSRREQLRFAPLRGTWGATLLARHPALADVDSVLWYHRNSRGEETILSRSDAVLAVLKHVGGAWTLVAKALRMVPHALRDWGYDWVAARRSRWNASACALPTEAQRQRFLL